jgi:hypothetical protein
MSGSSSRSPSGSVSSLPNSGGKMICRRADGGRAVGEADYGCQQASSD